MMQVRRQGGWIIVATFVIALMLTMLDLPDWAEMARPEWVAMVLIYWCMALPQRVGVGIAWILGLMLDVTRGAILGQYAMALALVAYLTLILHRRLRIYPLWQQGLAVLMLIAFEQMLVLWINGVTGHPPETWLYWLPSISSMLLWPWLFLILRDIRRRFQVN